MTDLTLAYELNETTETTQWVYHGAAIYDFTTPQDVNVDIGSPVSLVSDNSIKSNPCVSRQPDHIYYRCNYSGTYLINLRLTCGSNNSTIKFSMPELGVEYNMIPPQTLGGTDYTWTEMVMFPMDEGDMFHIEAYGINRNINIIPGIVAQNIGGTSELNRLYICKI